MKTIHERVIVVGSSTAKGTAFLKEASQLGSEERAVFPLLEK